MAKTIKAYNPLNILFKSALFLFFISVAGIAHAQDANSDDVKNHSVDPNMNKPSTPAQKKLAKEQKKRAKESAKATKAALKQHMKNQPKDVRKRMKKDYKEAQRNNEHKGEPFFKKLFRKKSPK